MSAVFIPDLPAEFEATRASLHAYAHAVGAVPRAHGIAHPQWWHVSLKPRPEGLATDPIPLPGGGTLGITLDLVHHRAVLRTSTGDERSLDLSSGATGTELADQVIAFAAEHGLEGGYDRERFENDDPRTYDPAAAGALGTAFTNVAMAFERHRVTLGSRVGPIQVWPHGFDVAFEWFGTRQIESDGAVSPAQLNLGWFPGGDRPYFYSNPWPFDESLQAHGLPHGAEWTSESFQGSILYSDTLAGHADAADRVIDYARAVHAAAAPLLTD